MAKNKLANYCLYNNYFSVFTILPSSDINYINSVKNRLGFSKDVIIEHNNNNFFVIFWSFGKEEPSNQTRTERTQGGGKKERTLAEREKKERGRRPFSWASWKMMDSEAFLKNHKKQITKNFKKQSSKNGELWRGPKTKIHDHSYPIDSL